MPRNTQFTVARGETFSLPVNLEDPSNTPLDITNVSFTGSLKETYSGRRTYPFTITKTVPTTSGSLEVFIDTIDLDEGKYVYSLFAEEGIYRRVIIEGDFIVRGSTL